MTVLKSILKAIFPRKVLKQAFLVYNGFKGRTWDKIFYREEPIPLSDFQIYQFKNPFTESAIDISTFDPSVQAKLSLWMNPDWNQDQYMLQYKKGGYIEPHFGWALTLTNKLIYPSLGFSRAPYVQKPGLVELFIKKRKTEVKFSRVISLRDTGEENYFHFFNDVISKLDFLSENGVDISLYTIVIGKKLFEKQYFQYYLDRSPFRNCKWHIQSDEYVVFEEAFFCKPFTHTTKFLLNTARIMRPGLLPAGSRRIFLTRSAKTLRYIENMKELTPLLMQFQFEIIDTSELSIESQIRLFQQCRYLIAIHGAGITNIIFRKPDTLYLLEILHPSPYLPFHYIMLCKLLGYSYDILLGTKGEGIGSGGFRVDIHELDSKLRNMVSGEQ